MQSCKVAHSPIVSSPVDDINDYRVAGDREPPDQDIVEPGLQNVSIQEHHFRIYICACLTSFFFFFFKSAFVFRNSNMKMSKTRWGEPIRYVRGGGKGK